MPTAAGQNRLAQAVALVGAGRFEEARAALMRLTAAAPGDARVSQWLAITLGHLKQKEQALYHAQRAAAAAPADPEARHTLASMLLLNGKFDEAIPLLESVIQTDARHIPAWNDLLVTLDRLQRRSRVVELAARAAESIPQLPEVWQHLASNLAATGEADAADAAAEAGLRLHGHNPGLLSQRAHLALYRAGVTAPDQRRIAGAYGRTLEQHVPRAPGLDIWPDTPGVRPLRVGFICADFRRHVSSAFLLPLLENLDRRRFTLFLYHTSLSADDISARFAALCPQGWRHMPEPAPAPLLQALRADRLDLLIDCAGHTRGHSLAAFHHRAAPVQATYLACPGPTGLSTMDYRLVDSITDPPAAEWAGDDQPCERPIRIDPCFVAFAPISPLPPVAPPPSDAGAPITFCSFNALIKLNDATFRLWARVLDAVPDSRLLIKYRGLEEDSTRAALVRRLHAAGAAADRLLVEGPVPSSELPGQYARADIGLDPFPYHGTTTTCEALSMGVPVVAMMGRTTASRVGGSLLGAVGLGDLAAESESGFVAAAAALAGDAARRRALRQSLRAEVERTIGDGPVFARRFGAALEAMWADSCSRRAAGRSIHSPTNPSAPAGHVHG